MNVTGNVTNVTRTRCKGHKPLTLSSSVTHLFISASTDLPKNDDWPAGVMHKGNQKNVQNSSPHHLVPLCYFLLLYGLQHRTHGRHLRIIHKALFFSNFRTASGDRAGGKRGVLCLKQSMDEGGGGGISLSLSLVKLEAVKRIN